PSAQSFGLPDWFPLQVTGVGIELEHSDPPTGQPLDVIAILSGGLNSSPQFQISATVTNLKVNLGKLANLFNPAKLPTDQDLLGALVGLDGFSVGVTPFKIGDS